MVFYPPSWVPQLPEVPDTVSIPDFLFDEQHGRKQLSKSKDPFTCGLSGTTRTAQEQKQEVDYLARALNKEFGWKVNEGTEYDKVVNVFAFNTVKATAIYTTTSPPN
jgi:hypothetical protein